MFLGRGALKICSKFTGEHPWCSQENTLRHGCSPVNLFHISRTLFPKFLSTNFLNTILKLTGAYILLLKTTKSKWQCMNDETK